MSTMESTGLPIRLYSCTHKPYPFPGHAAVMPVHCGAASSDLLIPGALRDDSGDHISPLNPHFSELSGLYWLWKNGIARQTPFWGLVHYRRYFCLPRNHLNIKGIVRKVAGKDPFDPFVNDRLFTALLKDLKAGRVIVHKPYVMYKLKPWNVRKAFHQDHSADTWACMEAAVQTVSPELMRSFRAVANSRQMSLYNMMVAGNAFWDEYLDWLFKVLFHIHAHHRYSSDRHQARTPAFAAERLMNVYLHDRQKKGLRLAPYWLAYFAEA